MHVEVDASWRTPISLGCSAAAETSPSDPARSATVVLSGRQCSLWAVTSPSGTTRWKRWRQPSWLCRAGPATMPDTPRCAEGGSGVPIAWRAATGRTPRPTRPTWRADVWCEHARCRPAANPASAGHAFPVSAGKLVDHDWRHQILWLEILELSAFAVYWVAQTFEHWEGGVPTGAERETGRGSA